MPEAPGALWDDALAVADAVLSKVKKETRQPVKRESLHSWHPAKKNHAEVKMCRQTASNK